MWSETDTDIARLRKIGRGSLRAGALIVAIALVSLMCGCTRPVKLICPSLMTYSASDESTLRQELASAALPETHRFVRDYGGLRDQVRACQAAQ
ncbi:hypothetical protein [Acetobacter fallax]|uniref:Uncharacterized protein n=1 Tax=Acetobacter fallax TaxID=1737473 RepID=A0ABX0KDY0_9PROT|nr:hypothetical protein [Acetobacter fallax]NHO33318.1 hypothetical protein [Acetobacter fallax]NHO36939.1 hypothetical protein [Acetobacter fallax]